MRFKQNIYPNSYLPVIFIFLIAFLFIPIAGNAGPLATIEITSVPALGTPPTNELPRRKRTGYQEAL